MIDSKLIDRFDKLCRANTLHGKSVLTITWHFHVSNKNGTELHTNVYVSVIDRSCCWWDDVAQIIDCRFVDYETV